MIFFVSEFYFVGRLNVNDSATPPWPLLLSFLLLVVYAGF